MAREGFSVHPSAVEPLRWYAQVPVPKGYEKTGEWRVPKPGETFLGCFAGEARVATDHPDSTFLMGGRRLILRPTPPPSKLRSWLVEETGEVRQLKPGEYGVAALGPFDPYRAGCGSVDVYKVCKVKELT